MAPNLEALGNLLRDSRNRLSLSQRAVETKTGVSNAYLSQLEGGKIKQPSPQILHKLCELYGASYITALELTGYPVPRKERQPAHARFAARLGRTSADEEAALLEYLQFLRSRRR
jgi:transcriptional regulator with XRE-family HTH domain